MIYSPKHYEKSIKDVNLELSNIVGEISDKKAGEWLIKYFKANLSVALRLLTGSRPGTGIQLGLHQEAHLKAMFHRNFSLLVHGRGLGKSYLASIFCLLYPLFNQGTKILIASASFRSSRKIFNDFEKIIMSPGAELLMHAFGSKASKNYNKSNDFYEWRLGSSTIAAIPLTERARGFRCNVLIIDEFLLVPKDFIERVLRPFLTLPSNLSQKLLTKETEDRLILDGVMKEEDRTVYENQNKIIALSSASYTFENLYATYQEWIKKIVDPTEEELESFKKQRTTYFVSQLSYESIPDEYIDKKMIEEDKNGGMSQSVFKREYMAEFTDESNSYFSPKKMEDQTIMNGEQPTAKLIGEIGKKYLLAIDPHLSKSQTSDYFAMSVFELIDSQKSSVLVHNYGQAGQDFKEIVSYLYYLLTHFNIEMIVLDNAGGRRFVDGCNESKLFIDNKIKLDFFEFDSIKKGNEYLEEMSKARNQYNKETGRICFEQVFTSDFIRTANEHLQRCLDFKKIWFGSRINSNDDELSKVESYDIDLKLVGEESLVDFIDTQDRLINEVKSETALMEPKLTPMGELKFELPQSLKRNNSSPKRVRKDLYTTLFMGNWAIKSYYDITSQSIKKESRIFIPTFIK